MINSKKEFLGTHLDKTGDEIRVYFSDHTPSSPAMSLLFKTYADLLDKNLARQKFYWDRFNNSVVVWAENKKNEVVSGIVFDFEKLWKAGYLLTTFTHPDYRNKGINKICFKYYISKSKEYGMVRTLGLATIGNDFVIKNKGDDEVSWGGGHPTFILFTQIL